MLLQKDVCRVHTSSLKPTLTEENKMSRMELALSFIDKNNTSKFENMEDLIHINEKWFYLTKDGQHFIIAADEEEPYRHVQHKSFWQGLGTTQTKTHGLTERLEFGLLGNGSQRRGHRRSEQRVHLSGKTN